MILSPHIFRAYDIRGIAFQDFDEDGLFLVCQSFCKYIAKTYNTKNPSIFVSGDARISMRELAPAVIAGLNAGGARVTWGGAIPTPINYFAFHEGNFDFSIQITASHNPSDYNGLKLTGPEGGICGEEIQEIRKIAECTEYKKNKTLGTCKSSCKEISFTEKYEQKLLNLTPSQSSKHIVIDCGNAIPGMFYPEILRHLGHTVTELFCDLDTTFPTHQPDPEEKENLIELTKTVQEKKADFGFAFDGDGDRIGIVLGDGTIINADKTLYVLTADFLTRHPNSKIILDAMTSATLIEKIKLLGGVPMLSKTGHSYIEEAMKKENALLGGEQSGHFMLGENFYGHDDALLAGIRFLSALESNPKLLDDITKNWPRKLEFSKKFKVDDEKKFEVLKNVSAELLKKIPNASTLDGIRIDFGEGEWGIIRCSNTSSRISVRIEAKNKTSLQQKKEIFISALETFL